MYRQRFEGRLVSFKKRRNRPKCVSDCFFHFFYTKTRFHPSIYMRNLYAEVVMKADDSQTRLEKAYKDQKPCLMSRLRAAGRSLEEAEDLVHDVYAEIMERMPLLDSIRNLPAWIDSLITKRAIDLWRHERVKLESGETEIAEETLREIIGSTGLDPQDDYVNSLFVEALNDAIRLLPAPQRRVVEAQVFGGKTFREISEAKGESVDTLIARKRYALRNLSHALRDWIEG
jgi:RNA polymerase sigma factor (sigma-70 family)